MLFPRILSVSYRQKLKSHLKKGGIIAYPTESCYGLGCLPNSANALNRLIRLKKRPQHKGMIVIGENLQQIKPLLQLQPQPVWEILNKQWPAPKTFLFPAVKNTLPLLRGKRRSKLAVRVPDHDGARRLCRELGTPLVSTSCNRAGKRVCKNAREVFRQFGNNVWVVRGMIGKQKMPSQIIDGETGKRLR